MIKIKTKGGSKTIQISVYIKGTFKNYLPNYKKTKINTERTFMNFPWVQLPLA